MVDSPTGLMYPAQFHGHDFLAPDGCWYEDEAAVRDAHWNIEPGDVVIDVGARYGSYAIPAAVCGGDVLAIDSDRRMLGVVEKTAQENAVAVRTACYAIGDGTPYSPELAVQVADPFMFTDPYGLAGGSEWTTLDNIVNGSVDWIKVDVEGWELAVLRGARKTLKDHHPKLLIEDHTLVYPWCVEHKTGEGVQTLLRSFGYHVEVVPFEGEGSMRRDFVIAT